MRAAISVIALLLVVSGCGNDQQPATPSTDLPSLTPTADGSTDSTGTPGAPTATNTRTPRLSPQQVRVARKTFGIWLRAFAGGDADRACPLQTRRFTQQQIRRLVEQDHIARGATCRELVETAGILFRALRLDASDAVVTRAPSSPDEVAFAVIFKDFAQLGYSIIRTPQGWRLDQDLTAS